jgi:membrane protein implicated in regulation of membrane protease activity
MDDWVVWLVVAAVLGALELMSLTRVLGFASLAAVAAGFVALAGAPVWAQLVFFSVALVVLLGVVRPVALRHRREPTPLRTGVDALVGQMATAISDVDQDGGQVKVGGEVWTARAAGGTPVAAGARVRVVAIQGATALVETVEG